MKRLRSFGDAQWRRGPSYPRTDKALTRSLHVGARDSPPIGNQLPKRRSSKEQRSVRSHVQTSPNHAPNEKPTLAKTRLAKSLNPEANSSATRNQVTTLCSNGFPSDPRDFDKIREQFSHVLFELTFG